MFLDEETLVNRKSLGDYVSCAKCLAGLKVEFHEEKCTGTGEVLQRKVLITCPVHGILTTVLED